MNDNPWWVNGGGFFGEKYMIGDDSFEGYLSGKAETLEERTKREVDGVISLLGLKGNEFILDAPCGYGRHAIELWKRGFDVEGVDLNKDLLHLAMGSVSDYRAKYESDKSSKLSIAKPGYIKINWKDIRRLAWSKDYQFMELAYRQPEFLRHDVAINMFYSFGFFETEEENEGVMGEFYNCLKPQGQLLLHTDVSPEIIASGKYRFKETRTLKSGRKLKIAESYDKSSKRINGSWTIIGKDRDREKLTPYSVRIYSKEEFEEIAKKAGFRKTSFYGSFDGKPFIKDSKELIMVAKK